MRRLPFRPLIEPRGVDDDLSIGRQFYFGAVHRPRSRSLEIDSLAVVAAAVAGTFELVFAGFPVWRASQVGAARIDHEYPIGRAIDPDAIFLLELSVNAKRKLRGITNLENGVRFEKSAGKKESEKSEEPCGEECGDAH